MRKYIAAVILIGTTAGLGYPIESAVVPAWSVTVVDRDGYPLKGVEVHQYWRHFALEKTYSSQTRTTNNDGEVHFPLRTIKASLLARLIRPVQMTFYYSIHRVQFEPVAHLYARERGLGGYLTYSPGEPVRRILFLEHRMKILGDSNHPG